MIELIEISSIERSFKSIFVIVLILLFRKKLNVISTKCANIILWSLLFLYLIAPYSFLIEIRDPTKYGILQYIIKLQLFIDENIREVVKKFGYILSRANVIFVSLLFLIYIVKKIIYRNKVLKNAVSVKNDFRVEKVLKLFKLKREVDILINDKIKVPITYGVVRPKIILQSNILSDEGLLRYVLLHELTHIKNFDIIFNHIKNLIICMYWYNIFILFSSKYIENDIEILCDKLVIQKLGDSIERRKEYCSFMLKLLEQKEPTNGVILKLQPTKERMIVMKKWKEGILGVFAFLLITTLSLLMFTDVKAIEPDRVVSSEISLNSEFNDISRVTEISEKEYKSLTLGESPFYELKTANINNKTTLDGLEHKSYKFDMKSWTEPNHDGFTVKMSDTSCISGVNYSIIIKEDGKVMYRGYFQKPTTLTVKAYYNSRYEVIIDNESTDPLTYIVRINSYIR